MVLSEEERKQRHREAQRRFKNTHPEYKQKWGEEYKRKHPEKIAKYNKKYRETHKEKINEYMREYMRKRHKETYIPRPRQNRYKNEACEILLHHHEDLKDDQERLSTDFIVGLVEKKNERET